MDLRTGFVANLLILGTLAYAAGLHAYDSDLYYWSVQEDEYVEWSTFWAFMAAAGVSIAGGIWQRRTTGKLPWFFFGVGLFCFIVAMEEISWGQRLIGYRPPEYFLEENFQQELNLHNVFKKKFRKLALKVIIGGYGIALPLVALIPVLGRLLNRIAIVPPPVTLVPAFLATYITYEWYPWRFSGEWVELMLGLGFLFAAILRAREYRPSPASGTGPLSALAPLTISWLLVIGLGVAQAALDRSQPREHHGAIVAAEIELEALKRDMQKSKLPASCRVNRRLYAYVKKYPQARLLEGEFSRLTAQGLPKERAEFFLDPWNSPYWVRQYCIGNTRPARVFVYSFGPNRKRESIHREIRGDDLGAIVR